MQASAPAETIKGSRTKLCFELSGFSCANIPAHSAQQCAGFALQFTRSSRKTYTTPVIPRRTSTDLASEEGEALIAPPAQAFDVAWGEEALSFHATVSRTEEGLHEKVFQITLLGVFPKAGEVLQQAQRRHELARADVDLSNFALCRSSTPFEAPMVVRRDTTWKDLEVGFKVCAHEAAISSRRLASAADGNDSDASSVFSYQSEMSDALDAAFPL